MSEMSNFLEDALTNQIFRGITMTAIPTVYAGLYTAAPSDSGGGTEVSGNGYARVSVAFGAPSNGQVLNSGTVTFATATASWGTITHFGIFDTTTSGNLLVWTPLDTSKAIGTNDVAQFATSAISVTFD